MALALPKALDIWGRSWLRRPASSPPALGGRHLVLCVCDHFEPFHDAGKSEAIERVRQWRREFHQLGSEFRDTGGEKPKQTFFYPIEQYDADVIDELAGMCHETGSETEVHLHHDRDSAENLRRTLLEGKERLAGHGLLSMDEEGDIRYGFIHGNWALDNSHPEGRACGVSNELSILRETGCYADFTLPSAPNRTQTRTINRIYYAKCTPEPKSHDTGRRVRADREPQIAAPDELLIVQGPLGLNWSRRKYGILPRLENSDLTQANPPTANRLKLWLDCRITVQGRPNWLFVKLHTHGAKPENARMLLGEPMRAFHRCLAKLASDDPTFSYHYVSAREMVNIVHAAEAGHSGSPKNFRNFRYRRIGDPDHHPLDRLRGAATD